MILGVSSEGLGAGVEPYLSTVEDFIRVRCSTNATSRYTEWHGSVFSSVTGERQKLLFRVLGMNVARCLKTPEGRWAIVSRELQYYLDPKSGELLKQWKNPWTGEVLRVIAVANNPVQNELPDEPFPSEKAGEALVFSADLPLTYPNALAADVRFAPYSPQQLYQAMEIFRYTTSEASLRSGFSADDVTFTWTRIGPWLPWMKMGDRAGQLVYAAQGAKFRRFEELSPLLQEEIGTRMPLYRDAPTCWLASPNVTSWNYFGKHFDAYLAGVEFPIPAPLVDEPCL